MAKSKFIPSQKTNPAFLQKKLEKLEKEVKLHGKNIDAISKSHDTHITMLSNFARHDIKNSVQSMDTILSTNTLSELTEEHLQSLKLSLNIVRETIDNFSKLVPYSERDYFELEKLITAIELLNRENFYVFKISLIKELPQGDFNFNLPFQSVLQMLNNIILNAVKAFEDCELSDRRIKISVDYDNENFNLKIFDNANKITYSNPETIFDYGISSTGGSGIGLYHARYLCNLYNGDIKVFELDEKNEYTKYFLINLPLVKK